MMVMTAISLLLALYYTNAFTPTFLVRHRKFTHLSAKINVKTSLPLGIVLEDADLEGNGCTKGVFVTEVTPLSDCGGSGVNTGYRVSSVNGVDVRFSDYDAVVELLTSDPESVNVEFEEKFKDGHAATIQISGYDPIPAAVGDNLRQVLLDNKLELYKGLKAKMGNCNGGGQCGLCKVALSQDGGVWPERSDHENKKLAKFQVRQSEERSDDLSASTFALVSSFKMRSLTLRRYNSHPYSQFFHNSLRLSKEDTRLACMTFVEGDCTVTLAS